MTFSDEGNNYYSFRIIIRINKNKKKRKKTSNTSSRDFRQNPHNSRTRKGTPKKTPPPLVGSKLRNLYVSEQTVNKNRESTCLFPRKIFA